MKKIAFFVQHMLCGGVENVLITLSKQLIKENNQVTIFVISKTGEFIDKVPEGVNLEIIPMPKRISDYIPVGGTTLSIRKNLSEHHYFRAAINLKNHIWGKSGFAELNIDFDAIPALIEEFDIAVCYHLHSPFLVRYLSEKVNAGRKLAWIHNDFSTTAYDIRRLKPYLECIEGFYAVSQQLFDEFVEILPEYKEKSMVLYNLVPRDEMLEKAEEGTADEFAYVLDDHLIILSVGRLESRKGYDLTIKVCHHLKKKGINFKWFILGEGSERKTLEKEIKRLGLQDTLFLLGIRLNPYPYYKNCDIYVQTSRHEGYVTTITEAKIFCRPVVCTEVAGAREQIIDGVNGFVVRFDESDIAEKIIFLTDCSISNAMIETLACEAIETEVEEYMKVFK